MADRRIAIVLFNLGGPDSPEAVQPFLYNLFSDKAIIRAPQPFRWLIAKLISSRRAPVAREIYAHIGGRSPIVPETEAQARALEAALSDLGEVKCFLSMRYWHPLSDEAAKQVAAFNPDDLILLPLYPQYSTTTTASSLNAWQTAWVGLGSTGHKSLKPKTICCYPENGGFVAAQAELIRQTRVNGEARRPVRVLFSAHGLPKQVIEAGDPYQAQVEQSVAAVVRALDEPDLDWVTCYQSRVGPLQWIGPSTEDEIGRAAADGRDVLVVPIAFVSEHSETLVELDIEYAELARSLGIETYLRAPTVSVQPGFINGLAGLVREALAGDGLLCPEEAAGGHCPERP